MQNVLNQAMTLLYKHEKGKIPALHIIDDIIEAVDFEEIQLSIPGILKILIESSKSSENGIRQASVYGLGIFAKFAGRFFQSYCMEIISALKAAIEYPGASTKDFDCARDNSIAGLGRIIKHQYDSIENIRIQIGGFWVDKLPLRRDKIEGREQHELLVDIILTKNASMVFGSNGEKMRRVLEIFGSIIDTNMSTPEIEGKIEKVLKGLIQNKSMSALLIKAEGNWMRRKKQL